MFIDQLLEVNRSQQTISRLCGDVLPSYPPRQIGRVFRSTGWGQPHVKPRQFAQLTSPKTTILPSGENRIALIELLMPSNTPISSSDFPSHLYNLAFASCVPPWSIASSVRKM